MKRIANLLVLLFVFGLTRYSNALEISKTSERYPALKKYENTLPVCSGFNESCSKITVKYFIEKQKRKFKGIEVQRYCVNNENHFLPGFIEKASACSSQSCCILSLFFSNGKRGPPARL